MFVPLVVPSVQEPTGKVALPAELEVAVSTDNAPPPLVTPNVTVAPETVLLYWSKTVTVKATRTEVPTVAEEIPLEATVTDAGMSCVPVAVNVMFVDVPATYADAEFTVAVVLKVQVATEAKPLEFEITVVLLKTPLPFAAKVTLAPETVLP